MKNLILAMVSMLVFVGCSKMDKPYSVAKKVYKVGEAIVPIVPMPASSKAAVLVFELGAHKYDKVRTLVRAEQSDSNTTK